MRIIDANFILISILPSFKDRPQFTRSSTEHEKCIGESASIDCSAVGLPMPDVLLSFKGNVLQRKLMNLTYSLQLDSENNFGSYMCVSSNTIGTANVTTTFKLKRKFLHQKSALSI